MMNDLSNESHPSMETYATRQYQKALQTEASMIKQKARIKWTIDGDKNNAYSYASRKNKQCKENIVSITDNYDNVANCQSEVEVSFLLHFTELFGNKENFVPSIEMIEPYIIPKVSANEYGMLCLESVMRRSSKQFSLLIKNLQDGLMVLMHSSSLLVGSSFKVTSV